MEFKDKLNKQFSTLRVSSLNESKSSQHIYADYVELVAVVYNDYVSKSEILDRLNDNGNKFSVENKSLDGEFGSLATERDDIGNGWINLVYEVIKDRVNLFDDKYPFILNENGLKLKDDINQHHKQYLLLLLCSSLNFFKDVQDVLTTEFEIISEKVLKNYLPSNASVLPFGNNSAFTGNAREKIRNLGNLLNIHPTDIKERDIEQIPIQSSKEEGLDLIGWIPFSDKIPNQLVILVQCGCGKPWFSKRFETSRYENFFSFYRQPPIHSLFIPYSLYKNDGVFHFSKNIVTPTLIFDRYRLMEYLDNYNINELNSNEIVDRCIEFEEDIMS
jgi:hypothetical protein